jgi:CRP-like cAMP-binding protein
MNTRLLEYILNGSIVINSLEVLGLWIKRFPDNPHLLKLYANLMAANTHLQAAANHYDRAAQIFFKEGRFLHGIATKIAQWQAIKPRKEEIELFLDGYENGVQDGSPPATFWKNLTPDELLDLSQIVENMSYNAGITVKQLGEVEKALNFVVSGELKESNYRMIEDQQVRFKKPFQILKPNDIFGIIYPFSEEIRSQSHIVALKRTELIRITKEKLARLCRVHPLLEAKIIGLLQIRDSKASRNGASLARKAQRYNVTTPISVEIIPDTDSGRPIRLAGFSRDLSVSGLCFLTPDSLIEESHHRILQDILNGRGPEVRVILSINKMSLMILSRLVRKDKVLDNGQIHLALGIRFDGLPPMLGGAFFAFAQNVGILNQTSTAGSIPSEQTSEFGSPLHGRATQKE